MSFVPFMLFMFPAFQELSLSGNPGRAVRCCRPTSIAGAWWRDQIVESAIEPPPLVPRAAAVDRAGLTEGGQMALHQNRLEPLPDGFVGFRAANGERWKHKDVEAGRTGPGYRLFVSESGEE